MAAGRSRGFGTAGTVLGGATVTDCGFSAVTFIESTPTKWMAHRRFHEPAVSRRLAASCQVMRDLSSFKRSHRVVFLNPQEKRVTLTQIR
jgi:hypothetical protein